MWAESNIPLYHLLSKNIPILYRWKDKSKPRFYFLSSVLNQTASGRETHSLEDWKRNVLGMHVSGFWFPVKWAVMSRLGMGLKIIRTASPLANLVTFPWVTFQIGKSVIRMRKTTDLELDILVSHWLHNASIKTNKQKKWEIIQTEDSFLLEKIPLYVHITFGLQITLWDWGLGNQ